MLKQERLACASTAFVFVWSDRNGEVAWCEVFCRRRLSAPDPGDCELLVKSARALRERLTPARRSCTGVDGGAATGFLAVGDGAAAAIRDLEMPPDRMQKSRSATMSSGSPSRRLNWVMRVRSRLQYSTAMCTHSINVSQHSAMHWVWQLHEPDERELSHGGEAGIDLVLVRLYLDGLVQWRVVAHHLQPAAPPNELAVIMNAPSLEGRASRRGCGRWTRRPAAAPPCSAPPSRRQLQCNNVQLQADETKVDGGRHGS
ncbi:hypothetical protein ON010_g17424 [Phytophthora cinnamomi]|nr:hypothetical protein ON010_g17424 [Phytophthora cinnamomi]